MTILVIAVVALFLLVNYVNSKNDNRHQLARVEEEQIWDNIKELTETVEALENKIKKLEKKHK